MSDGEAIVRVEWSAEDGEFVATCSAYPGLSALAPTPNDARAEYRVVLAMWHEIEREDAQPTPDDEQAPDEPPPTR